MNMYAAFHCTNICASNHGVVRWKIANWSKSTNNYSLISVSKNTQKILVNDFYEVFLFLYKGDHAYVLGRGSHNFFKMHYL